ncbi:host attachment family protein [Pseudoxanthobacter sp.]|uniref:host attachment family protein n=1 Tax=Pseudoxanthobacter sp. TaxID=1925742 RepID=UPI002FE19C9F
MTHALALHQNTLVVVADGHKALFLRNAGDEVFPNLKVEQTLQAPANPPTREQGTDRPGRVRVAEVRSSVEATDWHARAEEAFAEEVMAEVAALHQAGRCARLVLVAPPRMLASLRSHTGSTADAVVAELDKDLTNEPVFEIETYLKALH